MKQEIPLRILEERREKNKLKFKNAIYWFFVLIIIAGLIYAGIDNMMWAKRDKEYDSKIRSTLQTGPIQQMLPVQEIIEFKGVEITKLARYDITGKVIGMEFFYFGGGANKISQQDLAVCWGPACSPIYENDIKSIYTLNDRMASFAFTGQYYARYGEAGGNYISNNHIIPFDNAVKSKLRKVRNGDTVQMIGWLVSCKGSNWTWGPSSLVRTDSGNGACEIMLVEHLKIID